MTSVISLRKVEPPTLRVVVARLVKDEVVVGPGVYPLARPDMLDGHAAGATAVMEEHRTRDNMFSRGYCYHGP